MSEVTVNAINDSMDVEKQAIVDSQVTMMEVDGVKFNPSEVKVVGAKGKIVKKDFSNREKFSCEQYHAISQQMPVGDLFRKLVATYYSLELAIQRYYVWTDEQADKFIWNILVKFINTTIIVLMLNGIRYIGDGLQRSSVVMRFKNNQHQITTKLPIIYYIKTDEDGNFVLDKDGNKIVEGCDLYHMYYKDLPYALKEKFNTFRFGVEEYGELPGIEIVRLFTNANNGTKLGRYAALKALVFRANNEMLKPLNDLYFKYEDFLKSIISESKLGGNGDTGIFIKAMALNKYKDKKSVGLDSRSLVRFIENDLTMDDIDNLISSLDKVTSSSVKLKKIGPTKKGFDGLLPFVLAYVNDTDNVDKYLQCIMKELARTDTSITSPDAGQGTCGSITVNFKRANFAKLAKFENLPTKKEIALAKELEKEREGNIIIEDDIKDLSEDDVI